jgi:hypothetical protein
MTAAREIEVVTELRMGRPVKHPQREVKYVLISAQAGGATPFAAAITTAAPLVQLLNGMQRGTLVQQRIADKCNMLQYIFKGQLFTAPNATGSGFAIRVMVIADREANGTTLALSDLFGSSTPGSQALLNFNNRNIARKYTIFADKRFILGGTITNLPTYVQLEMDVSLRNLETGYERGNAGTVADIDTNAIYLVAICDNAVASQNYLTGESVLYFDDE